MHHLFLAYVRDIRGIIDRLESERNVCATLYILRNIRENAWRSPHAIDAIVSRDDWNVFVHHVPAIRRVPACEGEYARRNVGKIYNNGNNERRASRMNGKTD